MDNTARTRIAAAELEDIKILDQLVQASNKRKKSAVANYTTPKYMYGDERLTPAKTIDVSDRKSFPHIDMSAPSME